MSLLLIAQKLWRYKLATLPVIAFLVLGAFYVVAIKQPVYETASSYILLNPPAPPTPDEISRDPKLGQGTNNPYTRYSDQSIVVQVLASRLSGDDARAELAKQGADPRYTLAPSSNFGFSAPIVQITAVGASPAVAVRTANVVGLAMTRELDRMQQAHGTAPRYRIEAQPVAAAHDARLKASGKLRALVAVFVLGGIMLFVVVSIADALTAIRQQRRSRVRLRDGAGDHGSGGAHVEQFLRPDGASADAPLARRARDERLAEPGGWRASGSNGETGRNVRRLAPLPDPNPSGERWQLKPWE
jgi:hypothetical protein